MQGDPFLIALFQSCCANDPARRPSMSEVIKLFERSCDRDTLGPGANVFALTKPSFGQLDSAPSACATGEGTGSLVSWTEAVRGDAGLQRSVLQSELRSPMSGAQGLVAAGVGASCTGGARAADAARAHRGAQHQRREQQARLAVSAHAVDALAAREL